MVSAPSGDAADAAALAHVKRLAAEGYRLVGMLGRFESEGYKNSPAVFDVFARVLEREPDARLLLLARPDDVRPPDALRHAVVPLGFVSDVTLGAMMQRCALGLSMSRWEGFNLPLAEMQWYGRPVLAFNLAAHPEVTADPWLLCDSVGEMADKAVHLLERGLPPHILAENRFEQFRNRHRWRDVIERYVQVIEGLAQTPRPVALRAAPPRRVLLVDCTNAAVDPANPGVIRVTRRLGHALQQDSELLPIFARWDGELASYRLLNAAERTTLASYAGPSDGISSLFSQAGQGVWPIDNLLTVFDGGSSPVLFLPEVVLDGRLPERIAWARARGMLVAAILLRSHSGHASTVLFAFSGRSLSGISGRAGGDGCGLCHFAREPATVRALSCASQSALSAAAGHGLAARPVRCSSTCDRIATAPAGGHPTDRAVRQFHRSAQEPP